MSQDDISPGLEKGGGEASKKAEPAAKPEDKAKADEKPQDTATTVQAVVLIERLFYAGKQYVEGDDIRLPRRVAERQEKSGNVKRVN
jgi:hypothetical protein